MSEVITIKGKMIMGGETKGSALVTKNNLSFYAGIDAATALVTDPHSPLYGENVTGKVLVYPIGKSSTGNCWIMYTMGNRGNAPGAIINTKLDPIQVMGCICGNIPLIHVTECDPTDLIETGDMVEINGETNGIGTITITKGK